MTSGRTVAPAVLHQHVFLRCSRHGQSIRDEVISSCLCLNFGYAGPSLCRVDVGKISHTPPTRGEGNSRHSQAEFLELSERCRPECSEGPASSPVKTGPSLRSGRHTRRSSPPRVTSTRFCARFAEPRSMVRQMLKAKAYPPAADSVPPMASTTLPRFTTRNANRRP